MKHREDLFPHSAINSESYLISFTLVSTFKIALSLLATATFLLWCLKGKTQTLLINTLPVATKKNVFIFFFFCFVPFLAALFLLINAFQF